MANLPPNATATLKSVALKSGALVCGVADAAVFAARAPEKQRPDDLLPGARSVVVVGGAQPREGDWAATSPWVLSTMGTIGTNGRIAESTYNRERCHTRAQTYGIGSFQKSLLQIVNEDDRDRRHAMIHGDFFTKSLEALGFFRDSIAQCFECMRVCPVGRKYRKLQ